MTAGDKPALVVGNYGKGQVAALSLSPTGVATDGEVQWWQSLLLLLGSIKGNVGHANTAAGAASLAKVALSLRARALPPTIHAEPPSALIDWARLPLAVACHAGASKAGGDGARRWEDPDQRGRRQITRGTRAVARIARKDGVK